MMTMIMMLLGGWKRTGLGTTRHWGWRTKMWTSWWTRWWTWWTTRWMTWWAWWTTVWTTWWTTWCTWWMIWWRDKGVKDKVKQARRAKRVAEGHQLEIGAQRAPRFLVANNLIIQISQTLYFYST